MRRLAPLLIVAALAGCGVHVGGLPHEPYLHNAFGTIVSAQPLGDDKWNVTLDAEAVDCERRAERWSADVATQEALAPGARVGLGRDQRQNTLAFWPDFPAYGEMCRPRHASDILGGELVPSRAPPGATAVQLRGFPVATGERTLVALPVTSRQDAPILVWYANLSVRLDGFPSGGAPLCRVDPPGFEVEAPPRATRQAEVHVECPDDAPVGSPSSLAAIYGERRFVDELGIEHAHEGILWQFVRIGHPATLEIIAPSHAARPEDFILRAHYLDAQGAPIRGAQTSVRLEGPESPHVQFSMRVEGDALAFAWADMHEWTPRWRAGAWIVHIEADDPAGGHLPRAASATLRTG